MLEYISKDGEIFTGDDAFRKATSEIASFKFQVYETAAADPKLADTKCLQALVVYLSYVTIDEKTLKHTPAFASNMTLKVRAGIKTDHTANSVRALLVELGYLTAAGKSRDGSMLYHVHNPRREIVQMHMDEARDFWLEREAERLADKRRRRAARLTPAIIGGVKTAVTPAAIGGVTPAVIAGDSLKKHLIRVGSEGKDTQREPYYYDNRYQSQKDGESLPFLIPDGDTEADYMMAEIFKGIELSAGTYRYFRTKLFSGTLSPSDVTTHRKAFAA